MTKKKISAPGYILGVTLKDVKRDFDLAHEFLNQGRQDAQVKDAIMYAAAMLINSAEISTAIFKDLFINPKKEKENAKRSKTEKR